MMSGAIKLIMFDLDGTLIETASEIKDAVNDTLNHFQLNLVTQEQVNDWIGHGTHRLLIKALAEIKNCSVSEIENWTELKNISQVFNSNYQKRCGTSSQLYPHVKTVLKHLVLNNIRIAVVTNKESAYTHTILKQHQLDEVFDLVISGDTLAAKKPDPAGITYCLNRFQLTPTQALFVGDSSIDAQTAKNAGVPVWLLPYGYNMGQAIESANPDLVIQNFSEILTLLKISA
jgi:phosphoglycolate phosphatase